MKQLVSLFLCVVLLCACSAFAEEESLWTCPGCGREGNQYNFCPVCGEKRPEEKVCPGCGKTLDQDESFKFCPFCGASLETSATAEEQAPARLTLSSKDRETAYRKAIAATVQMKASAMEYCKQRSSDPSNDGKWFASMKERFASLDFANPLGGVLLEFTEAQMQRLYDNLKCTAEHLTEALNARFNDIYNRRYADAAQYSAVSFGSTALDTENCVAFLLIYENDISLMFQNGSSMKGLLLISSREVAASFGESYVTELLSSVGLSDAAREVITSPEALKAFRSEAGISAWSEMLSAVTASRETLLRILPDLYAAGEFTAKGIAGNVTEKYLRKHNGSPEELLAEARFVSSELDEAVKWLDPNGRKWHEEYSLTVGTGWPDAPSLALPEDFSGLTENPLKKTDRLLVISRNMDADDETYTFRSEMECALPTEMIPESLAEADYFLLIAYHWEENGTSNGIQLYKSVSELVLYDAKTLEPVYRLGSQEDRAEGFTLVSGNTHYQSPRYYRMIKIMNRNLPAQ